jgi:hypothetical protein
MSSRFTGSASPILRSSASNWSLSTFIENRKQPITPSQPKNGQWNGIDNLFHYGYSAYIMNQNENVRKAKEEISKIDSVLGNMEKEVARLRTLRNAWETILKMDGGIEAVVIHKAETTPDTAQYGDKTGYLRRFIVANETAGVTRHQIVIESKKISDTVNFPYRFIDRMLDGEELEERGERFYPLKKMKDRL